EVAAGSVARADRPLPAQGQVVVGGNASRDVHRDGALAPNPPLTAADLARTRDHRALAGAGRTGRDRHELAEHAPGGPTDLARATAGGAGGGLGAGLGPAAGADGEAIQ